MHEKWANVNWNMSNGQIARLLNISASTVSRYRKAHGIPPSTKAKNYFTDLHLTSSKTKPIRDLDYNFAYNVRKDGRRKATKPYRKAVIDTYGPKCKICGYYRPPIHNHVHHLVPLSQNGSNTIRNGIVLCSRCHDEVHAGLLNLSERLKVTS